MDYNEFLGGRPPRDWDDGRRSYPIRQSSTLGGLSSRGAPPECQSAEALQTRCAVLEEDLNRCMAQLSESRAEAAGYKADRARLASLELENDDLRRTCQENETRYQEVVDRHEVLDERRERIHASALSSMAHLHQQELEVAQRKYAELEKKMASLETEESIVRKDKEAWEDLHLTEVKKRKSLQKEIDTLREQQKLESPRIRSLVSQLREREGEVMELSSTVMDLQEAQSNLEPLAEIGAAIRTRFMNQARYMVTGEPSNRETIKKGNAAAHKADGRVDAALLNGDFMTKAEFSRMTNVFMDLYKQTPAEYGSWPQKILDAIDCEATIRTTLSVQRQLGSMPQRLQASEQMNELWRKFQKLEFDEFEENRDVQWRLDRLKILTEDIVEAARTTR